MEGFYLSMKKKLTKKQRGFVVDYVSTENGAEAVIKNYDVKDRIVAKAVASENLTKPYIQEAVKELKQKIGDAIPDKLLIERHLELLNKREVDFVFIEGKKEVLDQPDTIAVSKGLDMAYKLKDSYASQKIESVNVNINSSPSELNKFKKLREEYEAKLLKEIQ